MSGPAYDIFSCHLEKMLVGYNMLRQMLEKVTKARCVWVSEFSNTFDSCEIRSTKKLMALVHSGLSKLNFEIYCNISGYCEQFLHYGCGAAAWTCSTGNNQEGFMPVPFYSIQKF